MLVLGIVIGLVFLVTLVVVHELGHAIAARRSGVVVEEFGIGFPPRAWSKKLKSGLLFSLNWLPLGGFVKLQGEHDAATTVTFAKLLGALIKVLPQEAATSLIK